MTGVEAGDILQGAAECPASQPYVISGGYSWLPAVSSPGAYIGQDHPVLTTGGTQAWTVEIDGDAPDSGDILTVYAICSQ
jgi:hypothetical protein